MSRLRKGAILTGAVLAAGLLALPIVYAGSVMAGKKGVGKEAEVFSLSIGSGRAQVGYEQGGGDAEAWGPWSFTVLQNGNVAVLDAANQRLLVVDRSGEEVRSIPYAELGLASPVDLCEWRGKLAVAECNTTPEAVVLVDLAEAGPRFMGAEDGGLQLVVGMTESHRVTDGAKGHDLASIRKAEPAVDVRGVGKVVVEPAAADGKAGSSVRVNRATDRSILSRSVRADDAPAERVKPLGGTPAGGLLVDTAYLVPAGDGVQVKFYVEELSSGTLDTVASVTVPTDEFYLWPARYLSVDQKGQVWCMVAGVDRVSFRILKPTSGGPDVDDGSIARSVNAFAQRAGRAIVSGLEPSVALADASPPSRAIPWSRANGQSVASSYCNLSWWCSSGAYYRSCNSADNIRPRNIYVGGVFTGVSYGWGKWTTPDSFKSYVEAGTYDAGDIGSKYVESCVVGTDCSGLVSRIWGLLVKHSTTTLPAHATQLADSTSVGQLAFGDVFDRTVSPGRHVLCFGQMQGLDTFYCFEATTRNNVDRVAFWTRSKAELLANSYHIYRYNYWTN
jgi:hypothetical protein